MKNRALLIAAFGVLLAGGLFLVNNSWQQTETPKANQAAQQENPGHTTKSTPDQTAVGQENQAALKSGIYTDYSPAALAEAFKNGGKAVLFFHAAWCPFCRTADAAFKSQAGSIPAGVTVLKTNYDSETELKKKYGVTYQHTFVQIDAEGNLVTKWNSGDIDLLVKNIK